ncbi:MAG: ABC transporter permease subunit [Ruminococcus sp.]|nr:ABC transporter permease subunit [Ruminococcus sp.]
MRQLRAFVKKEFTDQLRSGKLFILGAVFLLFGIMSPATAKLTPKLLELVAEQDSGFKIDVVREVTAVDSFDQFFKNISTALIVFVILQAGIFTKEYSSGTLLLSLTRGMVRRRVIAAKTLTLVLLWTAGYFFCFGVAYGYTAFYWDVSAVPDLFEAVMLWWIYGLWYISLIVFFSVFISTAVGVIFCVGAVYLFYSLLGMIPRVGKYLPTYLPNAGSLTHGESLSFTVPLAAALSLIVLLLAASIPIFNRKQV